MLAPPRGARPHSLRNTAVDLSPMEIYFLHKSKLLSTWRLPPDHSWYAASHPGLFVSCNIPRTLQSTLTRFRSEHLRPMNFENDERIFLPCSCSIFAKFSHLFACLGVSWSHLLAEQERIFKLQLNLYISGLQPPVLGSNTADPH
ncbi:hypothetical protein TNCV_1982911 [Trichonephila clavipes]|nr:hypothetical protein TNCV_1982911 [Trichonephila clavipes]